MLEAHPSKEGAKAYVHAFFYVRMKHTELLCARLTLGKAYVHAFFCVRMKHTELLCSVSANKFKMYASFSCLTIQLFEQSLLLQYSFFE